MGANQSHECPKCPDCNLEQMLKDKSSVEKMILDKINSTTYTSIIGNFMLKKIINNSSDEEIVNKSLQLLCSKENANTFVNDEIINLLIGKNDIKKAKIISEIKGLGEEYKVLLGKILNQNMKKNI